MVRDPLEPQVVPQSRRVADHGRHDGGPQTRLSRRRRSTSRPSGANITRPSSKRKPVGRTDDPSALARAISKNPPPNDKEAALDGRELAAGGIERGSGQASPRRDGSLSLWRAARDRIGSIFSSPSNAVLRRLLSDQGAKHWKGYAFAFAMMALIAAHHIALGMDHRQDRRQDLRRPRPQGGLGDHRGDRGDLHGQGNGDLRAAGGPVAGRQQHRRRVFKGAFSTRCCE